MSSLNMLGTKWIFTLGNGDTYIWAYHIKKEPICNFYHNEGYVSKSLMVCVQRIEVLARVTR
jgi:hypothetical protein